MTWTTPVRARAYSRAIQKVLGPSGQINDATSAQLDEIQALVEADPEIRAEAARDELRASARTARGLEVRRRRSM